MALHFTLAGLQAPSWQFLQDTMVGRADTGSSGAPCACLSVCRGELSTGTAVQEKQVGSVSCLVLEAASGEGLVQRFSIVSQSTAPKLFLMAQQTLESLRNSLASASYLFWALSSHILLSSCEGHRLEVTIAPGSPILIRQI